MNRKMNDRTSLNAVIQRIDEIKKQENINTDIDFCTKINMSYDTWNSILKRDSIPKVEFLLAIKGAFEQYNLDWILTGKGSRYADAYMLKENTRKNDENSDWKLEKIKLLQEISNLKDKIIYLHEFKNC